MKKKSKYKVALVTLGHVDQRLNIKKIASWKSGLFEINSIQRLDYLPESDVVDGYLDHKFTRSGLKDSVFCPEESDIAISLISNRFEDNFYLHRLSKSCVAISIYGITEILSNKNISMEHFIIKQIYEIYALNLLVKDFSSDDVYDVVHTETRGCLFDLNGDRFDIVYNTEKPIICNRCEVHFKQKQLDSRILPSLLKELRRLRKPRVLRLELFVKKYPLLSVILSCLFAVALNLIASLIYDLAK